MPGAIGAISPFMTFNQPGSADRAFLFPGQGSQVLGMGKDLYENYSTARDLYDRADELLGFGLSRLCFQGPEADLQRTENTQPAIAVTSLALLKVAIDCAPELLAAPAYLAGHSLGEYPALIVAGAISFDDAIRLLRLRGQLMQAAADNQPGTMAAVMGLAPELCEEACRACGVEICTDNAPGQLVIGGAVDRVLMAMDDARARGAVRVVQLSVSGAFHSSLMRSASEGLKEAIAAVNIGAAAIPVIINCSATPVTGADEIRQELVDQVCRTVRWRSTMDFLLDAGVSTFIEFGPGKVLSSIVKRMRPTARTITVNDAPSSEVKL